MPLAEYIAIEIKEVHENATEYNFRGHLQQFLKIIPSRTLQFLLKIFLLFLECIYK
ncbi:MAG: hypothetical protein ACI85Q_002860 [Salibacteraceae bacterium]|jgi:hypothetical protein